MKFESQICTTTEQSERLIALGLKRDTADMHHYKWSEGYWDIQSCPPRGTESCYIPAWSLDSLLNLLPISIEWNNIEYDLIIRHSFDYTYHNDTKGIIVSICNNNRYEGIIRLIEWLIKEGYFNKEYLND